MHATKKSKNPFQGMTERRVTPSDGNPRTMYAKKFDTELRVYRIEGDVSDLDALAECGQILAIESGCSRVTMKF